MIKGLHFRTILSLELLSLRLGETNVQLISLFLKITANIAICRIKSFYQIIISLSFLKLKVNIMTEQTLKELKNTQGVKSEDPPHSNSAFDHRVGTTVRTKNVL